MNLITAAKREGYMKKGSGFKPLPKRNSDAYQQNSPPYEMIEEVQHVQYCKNERPATCETTKNDM
jgi:hypothetical protein